MNPTIAVAIIGLIASVSGIYIAQRITARTARRAADTTAALEEKKLDQETWQQQYQGWKDDALKLRELRDQDQARYERDRDRWETKITDCDGKITTLTTRLDDIQHERAKEQEYLDSIVSWCRVVVVLLRQAGIAYPPLPPGVSPS